MTVKYSSKPPLLVSLLNIRKCLDRFANELEFDHPLMDIVAELQAHLKDAFQGAKVILLQRE